MTSETRQVRIEYCTQCRWLPRAAWLAQELPTTFEAELDELALKPGTGGVFVVRVGDEVVWDRREHGFPEPTAVKRRSSPATGPGAPHRPSPASSAWTAGRSCAASPKPNGAPTSRPGS
ncbi:SelT/SelW/SelH family protein [Streptomyces vietnamensis]|uniref:SelT/SelW/SelH family protein n=1 Tax=Streptomyces vietnamensis TaxID=362257 RepID=UPI000A4C2808|nr:Rdx family protein [Streptomyces vietnamensis]